MDETAIRKTLVKIAQYIREGARTPSIRKIADSAVTRVYPRGVHTTNRDVAQALLDWVREHVRYRPDPRMVEMVQNPKITLCADDAPICIPVGDCDDLVSAYGAFLGSMGVDVKVLVQDYGPEATEQHVLILFEDDDGTWLTADPSSKSKPIGLKDPAVREYTVDPLTPEDINMPNAPQAEFITVGRPQETLGHGGKKPCCKSCGEGGPCTGCGSKVHPCPCETGQMVGAGAKLPFRPMIGARRQTLGAQPIVAGMPAGSVIGGLIGGAVGFDMGKKKPTGWKLVSVGLGIVIGSIAGNAIGNVVGGS